MKIGNRVQLLSIPPRDEISVKLIGHADYNEIKAIREALVKMPYRENKAVIEARLILHKKMAKILSRTILKHI